MFFFCHSYFVFVDRTILLPPNVPLYIIKQRVQDRHPIAILPSGPTSAHALQNALKRQEQPTDVLQNQRQPLELLKAQVQPALVSNSNMANFLLPNNQLMSYMSVPFARPQMVTEK